MGIYKVVSSHITDKSGRLYSVVGKIVDISEEEKEKERLITKSQLDGLTDLYNATTTKELICKSIVNRDRNQMDAFIIIDCDKFKDINDNFGHLEGDLTLERVGKSLKDTFRHDDIIGRIGGDEFCVYMSDIPSIKFVCLKCQQLTDLIKDLNEGFQIAVSIGIAILKEESTYEDLFKQADDAMYHAKKNGGGRIVVYGEKESRKFGC